MTSTGSIATAREISVLKTEPEDASIVCRMFKIRGQILRDKLLVLEAVTDEGIEPRIRLPGGVGRASMLHLFIQLSFRVTEADTVPREDPDPDSLSVDDQYDEDDHGQKEEAQSSGDDWNVVQDGSIVLETCHDVCQRIYRAAPVEFVQANDLAV